MKENKSQDTVGKSFMHLVQIAATLRGDHGCVWDKEQTKSSIKPFFLEECYEVLAAIDEDDSEHIKEELGDLLYQIIFLARIAAEEKEFDIVAVIETICDKLIRRHPHVFGEETVASSREVLERWEQIKRAEGKSPKESVLDGVPRQLPGLLRAHRIQEKAARVGFDWDHADQVLDKIKEEMAEFETAFSRNNEQEMEDELGDVFFALVNMARFMKIDPEKALSRSIARFIFRFRFIEQKARERGKDLAKMSLQEMDELWKEAKEIKFE
ncbi:MAG: nucleoside triphosphate pyrophosphohydrolase [bacterium]